MTSANIPGMGGVLVAPPPTSKRSRAIWLAARKRGLGASEVATILGLAPTGWKSTPLSIWLDKTHPDVIEKDVTERMEWGTELEAPVARVFARRHAREFGIRVAPTPGLLAHEKHPWLLATPDRIGVDTKTKLAVCPIEVKTSDALLRKEWDDGVPMHYDTQIQVQMAVTGLPYAILVPLFGGNYMPEPFVVERDEVVIGQIIEYCEQWWETYVVGRVMPPPLVADSARLPEVWPGGLDDTVTLEESLVRNMAMRAVLEAERDSRQARIDEITLAVKVAMGDHKRAVDEDGHVVATWSRFTKRTVDWKSMAREHPEVASLVPAYTNTKPTGRFVPAKHTTEES